MNTEQTSKNIFMYFRVYLRRNRSLKLALFNVLNVSFLKFIFEIFYFPEKLVEVRTTEKLHFDLFFDIKIK